MNNIYSEIGGRPRKTDDLLLIQEEANKASSSILKHLHDAKGGFILKGCTPNHAGIITAGMIYLNYEFLEFDGATNVTYPAKIGIKEELTNDLQYEDGGVKPTRKRRYASLDADADFTVSLTITPTLYVELNDLLVKTYGEQAISGNKSFRNELLVKGLNVYDELVKLTNGLANAVSSLTAYIDNKVATLSNKADKTSAPTWITLQPSSAWITYPSEELQVTKDQFGTVILRGTVTSSAPNTNSIISGIATLPVGYRPIKTQQYVVWQSGNMFGSININPDGTIDAYNPTSYPNPRFVLDNKLIFTN